MKRLTAPLLFLLIFSFYNSVFAANGKLIVLTFDDGPRPYVLLGLPAQAGKNGQEGLIDVLQSQKVSANFFVIGGEAKAYSKLISILNDKGFLIENHTYWHDNLLKLRAKNGYDAVLESIQKTDKVVFEITGRYPKYFRPPYWAIDADLKKFIADTDFGAGQHYRVVSLENPDINTLDYDDHSKKRSSADLIERVKKIILSRENRGEFKHVLVFHELPITVEALKVLIPYFVSRGYAFGTLDDFFQPQYSSNLNYQVKFASLITETSNSLPIKSVYLGIDYLYNQKKIDYIFSLFDNTELTAVVIDFKVDRPQINQYVKDLIARFHKKNIYVIGRLVMFQDSYLAKIRPYLVIRNKNGDMCFSGRKVWQRHWVDMASEEVLNYNIEIAKRGIDMGFDEINFDYIRFPSDLNSCSLKNNIIYPIWNGKNKHEVMHEVFANIKQELKTYAYKNNTNIKLSIDIFGEVFAYGEEPGIGQKLSDIAEFFDVINPMAYPSHYQCNEFGIRDPNSLPYIVYKRTLEPGLKLLREIGFKGEVRPWIQDFSIANIYNCGPIVYYGPLEVKAQINASSELGLTGYMIWNAANNYTKKALMR